MELEYIDDETIKKVSDKSNLVKFVALYDLLNSMVYLIFIPYYGFAGIFSFVFSYIGFIGAKNLKKINLLIYSLYLLFQNIIRIIFFALILWNPVFFSFSKFSLIGVIINSLFLFINLFLNYYVFSLYNLIKKYNQHFLDLVLKEPEYVVTIASPV